MGVSTASLSATGISYNCNTRELPRLLSQDSKERLFGSFSGHISTKKVKSFHGRYSTKMTVVFVGTPSVPYFLLSGSVAAMHRTQMSVLRNDFAAIWAVR